MRILKNHIYESILLTARKEFLSAGFKDASMRAIAQGANVGLSNIYNYFRNKDDIFRAIVQPALDDIYAYIDRQHSEENTDLERFSTIYYQEEAVESYIRLIDCYREELYLLFFQSEGSSIKNFRETFTDYLTDVNISYQQIVKKHYPASKEVSLFFMHTLSAWMVSILSEIIRHRISRRRMREFFREYFRFEFAGWQELIEVERKT
ncbi:MAG: TetR/AcrR family transcriptional regulator [Massilibacteroides sp.]|nr:TetR/AcrR family transcriptional regulator [Massilibacteroides sp.]MDD3061845.1 TetR/AcrR family transcriptional regulator [Massilibacteroides sp.]MDD4115503.1 TetR/AcrR family transcriptional regulator [Massilibacteroides sp.]MDD4660569.1 TetR/AcrR family transcriptional regulator [Massilibacteroides sp.]